MREDDAFNMFHEEELYLTDNEGRKVKIDINPINSETSGTINDKLEQMNALYQFAETAGAEKGEEADAQKEYKEKGTESKYFKRWFGDSKVVDENGKPLIVYHGTRSGEFSVFKLDKSGSQTDSGMLGKGFYFSSDKEYSKLYAGGNEDNIMPVYLSLKNPLIIDDWDKLDKINEILDKRIPSETIEDLKQSATLYSQAFRDYLIENGYDGVIEQADNGRKEYVAFYPEQIKSVDNQGTFDSENPNIYYQKNVDKIIDLTDEFPTTPKFSDVENYINKVIESGKEFATASPEWRIDIKKENSNNKQKRITNKLLNNKNFKGLSKQENKRLRKYLVALEKILANAEYIKPKKNTKPDKKPFVKKYHYFKSNVKIRNKIYELLFDTEEYKNDKSSLSNYSEMNNSKKPKEDINSITDNGTKINPKTVHLYNISEVAYKKDKFKPAIYYQSAYNGSPSDFDKLQRKDGKYVDIEYYDNSDVESVKSLNIRNLKFSNIEDVKKIKKNNIKDAVFGGKDKIYIKNKKSDMDAGLSANNLKEIISSVFNPKKESSYARLEKEIITNVQTIFENAIPVLKHPELKNENLYDTQIIHRFALPVKIGGNNFLTMITVKERTDHKQFDIDEFAIYDLKSQIRKMPDRSSMSEDLNKSGQSRSQASKYSINDLTDFIKGNIEKYTTSNPQVYYQELNPYEVIINEAEQYAAKKVLDENSKS